MNDQLPPGPTDQEINDRLEAIEKGVLNMLTVNDYLSSSGKYLDRAAHASDEVKKNAEQLLASLNAFLNELNVFDVKISSGFRTPEANEAANGAKKSLHMEGKAIDLEDQDGSLDDLFQNNLELMEKYGLYLENPDYTKLWSHIQNKAPRSGRRIFIP